MFGGGDDGSWKAQMTLHPDVPGTWFQVAIELAETGELIGDCGLHTLEDPAGQSEIGFTLAASTRAKAMRPRRSIACSTMCSGDSGSIA